LKTVYHEADFCVVGGGIAGTVAAIAAARHGMKVVLMQDRPVLGGNASSEIRMWICGARGENNRETGIVEEIQLENYYRNEDRVYTVWDSVVYEKAYLEKNIKLLLNCTCQEARTNGGRIQSVKGWQMTSETYHIVRAKYFADCSGDSILAPLTGAEYMVGRESKADFGEAMAPAERDSKTMGMSCLFQIRETDSPKKFIKPEWARTFRTDEEMNNRGHRLGTNFWWIELGGDGDSIHDTDDLRHELLNIAFGVWDHLKNQGDHGFDNWVMDWIGFLPGKRESRRYVGEHIITQNDVEAGGKFDDIVAYGGWPMDDHNPLGFNHRESGGNINYPAPSPWGIPWRSLYSVNIENLLFAGRNISATHAAMSSSRVMGTCALVGQAVGTGVAQAVQTGRNAREIDIKRLQQTLLYDDCFLPGVERELSELTKKAKVNSEVIRNGMDRDYAGQNNAWEGKRGDRIELSFDSPEFVSELRLIFDSDLNRKYLNMPCKYPLKEENYKLPPVLIKAYRVYAEINGEKREILNIDNNRKRFVLHEINQTLTKLIIEPAETWGSEVFRVFSVDVK
jgi:hypothetical protein